MRKLFHYMAVYSNGLLILLIVLSFSGSFPSLRRPAGKPYQKSYRSTHSLSRIPPNRLHGTKRGTFWAGCMQV